MNSEEKQLLAKARRGDTDAMFELSNYYTSIGDKEKASKWLKKAKRRGHKGAKRFSKYLGMNLPKQPTGNEAFGCCGIIITIIVVLFCSIWYLCGIESALMIIFAIISLPIFFIILG